MLASRRLWASAKSANLDKFGAILFEWDYSICCPRRNWRIADRSNLAGESNGDRTQDDSFIHRGHIGWSEGAVRWATAAGASAPRPQIPDASVPDGPLGEEPPAPHRDPQEQLKENQKILRRDADRLAPVGPGT